MSKIVTATELQENARDVIDWTRTHGEPVIVETSGEPLAAILAYDEYQAYLKYKQARTARFARLREAVDRNAATNELTEAEAIALVETARQER
ncbi:MAG: hypothetical protein ETSY1_43890 [Candidatus Entotheonella factor]|uniref:Antitoxin n=1 Tax=Entotheonella factor TaxID=1429438 RepID=W4L2S3_ENTF1|nr:MAG: hypothetical protein ETSY1_43890 [Candidatus Entotheonella factor]